jgi:o-succinylbenzoate synthase
MTEGPATARLVAMRWRPFRLPLRHRFEAAHGALTDRLGILLELHAEDGTVGIGEASPYPSLGDGTVEDVVGLLDACASRIVTNPTAELADLDAMPAGTPGVAALRCALDVARLDIEARQRGVSVSALLAESPVASVAVNAVIGGGPPEEVARFGSEAIAAGYTTLKVKVGVGEVGLDVARIEALRAACPSATIRVDANGAWTELQAREALVRLAPYRIELVEQPVGVTEVEGLGRLRTVGVPLAADEAVVSLEAAERVITARAVDLLVLKPMRLGGLRPALAIAHRAADAGVDCIATTTFDSSIGTAAALHLAAALPGGPRHAHGLSTGDHLATDLVARPLLPSGGRLAVPSEPGLGIHVDAASLEALATGPWVEQRSV